MRKYEQELTIKGLDFKVKGVSELCEDNRMVVTFDVPGPGLGRITVEYGDDEEQTERVDRLTGLLKLALAKLTMGVAQQVITEQAFQQIVEEYGE